MALHDGSIGASVYENPGYCKSSPELMEVVKWITFLASKQSGVPIPDLSLTSLVDDNWLSLGPLPSLT